MMKNHEQIIVAVLIAWVAFMAGKKNAAAATPVAAVPTDPLAWLNLGQV